MSTAGDWKLTGSLGALASKREQDAYLESNGASVPSAETSTVEQYNLLLEAAYGRATLDRLAALKRKLDPDDFFRHNKPVGG